MNKKRAGTYYSHFHPAGTYCTVNSSLLYEVYAQQVTVSAEASVTSSSPLTICLRFTLRTYTRLLLVVYLLVQRNIDSAAYIFTMFSLPLHSTPSSFQLVCLLGDIDTIVALLYSIRISVFFVSNVSDIPQ